MENPIPASIDLERNILGLCLLQSKFYEEIKDILSPKHFADIKHLHLYSAIQKVYEKEKTVSVLVLHDYLNSNNLLELIGGIEYFIDLQTVIDKTDELSVMAKTVIRKYQRRSIQETINKLNSKLKEDLIDTDAEIDNLITDIIKANNFSLNETFLHGSEIHKTVMNSLVSKPPTKIKSGFIALDDLLGGFTKKNLILLAARPSMGKTMLALNIMMNMVKNGHPVAMLSLEMSYSELHVRLITSLTGIPYKSIMEMSMTSEEFQEMSDLTELFEKWPMHISESSLNIQEIKRSAVRLKREHNIEVLFIDYLQLISGVKYTDNRNLEIGGITKDLKTLAKELDIAVILLSQLNRGLETRPDKRPIASDLRDSGSIEQDADIVMFIYRDVVYNKEANPSDAEIIINKNRNGESHRTINLSFEGRLMKFTNKKAIAN